ncbi:hypothetical protein [Ottowia thiooxydans]|uniref:hypothetical protein n=1 Tax=Ottowia thiooxydans TaxID=219182 RepID=UPI000491C50D|nr:hypothetical protein [Ottowia thiooxydans]
MFNSLADFLRAVMRTPRMDGGASNGITAQLMERADAAAGSDPMHAFELRRAALATLGVVR